MPSISTHQSLLRPRADRGATGRPAMLADRDHLLLELVEPADLHAAPVRPTDAPATRVTRSAPSRSPHPQIAAAVCQRVLERLATRRALV